MDDNELGTTLKDILSGVVKLTSAHDERIAALETKKEEKDNAPTDDKSEPERKPERKSGGFLARLFTK